MPNGDWKTVATEMFYEFQKSAEHYKAEGVAELALVYASKATALSELLEKFDAKPKI